MSVLKPSILAMVARRAYHSRAQIGKREVVGFGANGSYHYSDRDDVPYPAIRWQEPGPHIDAILQKEKGDWKNLTIDEKKALYRYSYRQTFVEFDHTTHDWKFSVGVTLIGLSIAMWIMVGLRNFVMPPLPESCSEEHKQAQLKRMIDIRANPIEGIASKWDYENNRWK